ncbi:MAG: Crp/Fnr family transcriptional regulator [Leptolyngbyaceae bacterium]|nr:Crp/Fnr family transcriptional regulator [Leptolyngbyaceae bacterium]
MVLALDHQYCDHQTPYHFSRRELLPFSHKQLWLIESGIVRSLTWDLDGRVFVLGLWGNGDVVGQTLSGSEHYQLECLSPVTARQLPISYYCQRNELLSYLKRTEKFLIISQMRSVSDRLVHFLEYFAYQFGTATGNSFLLNIYLTHQDIADTINSSRVTVTRLMGKLHRKGYVRWHRDKRKRFLVIQNSITQAFTHGQRLNVHPRTD